VTEPEHCIIVNEQDHVLDSCSKQTCHQNQGQLHRAFSVLLFNAKNELLIQQRAADKVTFPLTWANTCCSHPHYTDDELQEDDALGVKRSAIRRLHDELGIEPAQVPIEQFQCMTRIHYKARYDEAWSEQEIDYLLVIRAEVDIQLNRAEVAAVRWVSPDQLETLFTENPDSISPWFREIKQRFLAVWWNDLDNLQQHIDDVIHRCDDVSRIQAGLSDSVTVAQMSDELPVLYRVWAKHRSAAETSIDEALSQISCPRLHDAIAHLIQAGGKRLRAVLPALLGEALGHKHQGHYQFGAAMEMIHNFTLIHDDIMDNDDLRRGQPSVHVAFDPATAINAGDTLFAMAFHQLSQADAIPDEVYRPLTRLVSQTICQVAEGQQQDADFEMRNNVSETEYYEMIEGKTASMFRACTQGAALLAQFDDEIVEVCTEWGLQIGFCFQMIDDLLDIISEQEVVGKPIMSDILQHKQTLVTLHALQQPAHKLPAFHHYYGSQAENIDVLQRQQILAELTASGTLDYVKSKAGEHHARAMACLDKLPESATLSLLYELTDYQVQRIV
jgi:geranylgeranyl diphosphate synthase, type I